MVEGQRAPWHLLPDRAVFKVFVSLLKDTAEALPQESSCAIVGLSSQFIRDALRFAFVCQRFKYLCASFLKRIRVDAVGLGDAEADSLDISALAGCIRLAGSALLEFSLIGLKPDFELVGGRQIINVLMSEARSIEVLRLTGAAETRTNGLCYFENAFKHRDICRLLSSLPKSIRVVETFRSCTPSEFRTAIDLVSKKSCPGLERVCFESVEPPLSCFTETEHYASFWQGAPSKYFVGKLGHTLLELQMFVSGGEDDVGCRTLRQISVKCPQLRRLELQVGENADMRAVRGALKGALSGYGLRRLEGIVLGNLRLSPRYCREVLGSGAKRVGLRNCVWKCSDDMVDGLIGIANGGSKVTYFEGSLEDFAAVARANTSGLERLVLVNYGYEERVEKAAAAMEAALSQLSMQNLTQVAISGSRQISRLKMEIALLVSAQSLPLQALELTRLEGLTEFVLDEILRRCGCTLVQLVLTSCPRLSLSSRTRSTMRHCSSLRHLRLWSANEGLSEGEEASEFIGDMLAIMRKNSRILDSSANLIAARRIAGRSRRKRKIHVALSESSSSP